LSKYRSYDVCPACEGARLKPESLLWRIGTLEDAAAVVEPSARFRPKNLKVDDATFAALPGLTVHDVMLLPLDRALVFFEALRHRGQGPFSLGNWGQSPFSPSRSTPVVTERKRALTPISERKRARNPISTAAGAPVLDETLP